MALTKEDLQAIRAAVKEEVQEQLEPINNRLGSLETEMRSGFEQVRGDITTLQEGQRDIRGDISDLYKNHEKSMDIIKEGLPQIKERYAQLETVEATVEDHSHRIFALEQKAANE